MPTPRFNSRTTSGDLTRDLKVLSRDFAVKITYDFDAKRRPQNQSNLLQVRRTIIKGHNIKKKQQQQQQQQNKQTYKQ